MPVLDTATPALRSVEERLAQGFTADLITGVTEIVHEREVEQFASAGGETPWPALIRPRANESPLVRSGKLFRSLTSFNGDDLEEQYGPWTLGIGTRVWYWRLVSFGTKKMAARPLAPSPLPADDVQRMVRLIGAWLTEGV